MNIEVGPRTRALALGAGVLVAPMAALAVSEAAHADNGVSVSADCVDGGVSASVVNPNGYDAYLRNQQSDGGIDVTGGGTFFLDLEGTNGNWIVSGPRLVYASGNCPQEEPTTTKPTKPTETTKDTTTYPTETETTEDTPTSETTTTTTTTDETTGETTTTTTTTSETETTTSTSTSSTEETTGVTTTNTETTTTNQTTGETTATSETTTTQPSVTDTETGVTTTASTTTKVNNETGEKTHIEQSVAVSNGQETTIQCITAYDAAGNVVATSTESWVQPVIDYVDTAEPFTKEWYQNPANLVGGGFVLLVAAGGLVAAARRYKGEHANV
ncbi:MAG: hypothetical protein WBP26_04725 [Candidatus Saccharimonadales bacterium]